MGQQGFHVAAGLRREGEQQDEGRHSHLDSTNGPWDSLIQQADKFVEYQPTEKKVIAIVEAKMAMRSPHDMDVDAWWNADEENENEDIQSLASGGIHCFGCGGHGHVASKCGTPEPQKGKGGKDGKGGKAARAKANTSGPASAARRVTVVFKPWTTLGYEPLPRSRTRELRHWRIRHRSCGLCDGSCGVPLERHSTELHREGVARGHGESTLDSGAAESVLPPEEVPEIPIQE